MLVVRGPTFEAVVITPECSVDHQFSRNIFFFSFKSQLRKSVGIMKFEIDQWRFAEKLQGPTMAVTVILYAGQVVYNFLLISLNKKTQDAFSCAPLKVA